MFDRLNTKMWKIKMWTCPAAVPPRSSGCRCSCPTSSTALWNPLALSRCNRLFSPLPAPLAPPPSGSCTHGTAQHIHTQSVYWGKGDNKLSSTTTTTESQGSVSRIFEDDEDELRHSGTEERTTMKGEEPQISDDLQT